MDWNWFFSSVAQSSAAIVGLFGAFIITKIINNQNDYGINLNRCNEYVARSFKLKNRADCRYFDWYNKKTREREIGEIIDEIEETKDVLTAKDYYQKYDFSIYDDRQIVLSEINLEIKKGRSHVMNLLSRTNLYNNNTSNNISNEAEEIAVLLNDINEHIYLLQSFIPQIKTNPQSSKIIKWSIVGILAMFFMGVVFPLCFMPIALGEQISISFKVFMRDLLSIKGVIIFTVSIIFSVIMIVFLRINHSLKYPKTIIESLTNHQTITYYSPYFGFREDNLEYLNNLNSSIKRPDNE